jgi:hypothetical protein
VAYDLSLAHDAARTVPGAGGIRAPIRMTHSSRTAKSQQIRMQASVRSAS